MKTYSMKIFGFVASVAAAVLMVASCGPELGPDQQGGGQVDETYESFVDSLENVMYRQARAMQIVLTPSEEPVSVSSCVAGEEENIYEITLSTGASFPILIDEDEEFAEALSYVEEDGKMYWAICDKEGNVAAVEDAEGTKVELSATVDVKIADKKYCLELGEASYDMGYGVEDMVQMYDCRLLKDDADVVYAVEFDFGQNKTKVVYLADYAGLYYYLPADAVKASVSEMYVNKAGKATLAVNIPAEISWQPVADEGWSVALRKEGEVSYVDITAPEQYEVTEESQPVLKAVSQDGSFVFATVNLTNRMYRTFAISVTDAVIAPSTGLGKFAYGISLLSDFEESEVVALAGGLIAGTAEPSTGNGVSGVAVSKSFADILGTALDPEARYVLWAYADGELKQMEFGEIAVEIEIENTALLDAQIKVTVSGADALYGGVIEKTDDMKESILYQVTNRIYDPVAATDQKFEYDGAASDFPVADNEKYEFLPQTEYAVWVVPAVDGDYEYTEKDLVIKEFKTNSITAGGSLELTCGEPTVTPSSISFPLSCDGAAMIYYAFFTKEGGDRFSAAQVPDEYKFAEIINEASSIRMGKYVATVGDEVVALGTNLNDEAATDYWMFAVAVDGEGKYGKVHCVSAKTLALAYDNTISLKVENIEVKANKATVKVTSTGGDLSDYIYWMGMINDPFWANSSYCHSDRNVAQKYMALNPENENIKNAMSKYGKIAEDGTITFDGLQMESAYVFLIMEKGDVYYSPIAYKLIKTLAVNLGNIVREGSDKWKQALSDIQIEWFKDRFHQASNSGLMSSYSFNFKCPDNLTAYVLCGSEDYFSGAGITKMEQIMIEIENTASRRYENGMTPIIDGELVCEPDYYSDGKLCSGQLMNVCEYYVHGIPSIGFVTYFAKGSHGKDNCIYWGNNQCTIYEEQKGKIARHLTMEPYQARAKMFGLEGAEAETWAQALLEAYRPYYQDAKPFIFENDGNGVVVSNPYATGINENRIITDRVIVMFKDLQGNYYEPMYIEVPNYFEGKQQ